LGMNVIKQGGKINYRVMKCTSKHYFERMGLFKFLNLDSKIKIKEHDSSGRFIPLTIIKKNYRDSYRVYATKRLIKCLNNYLSILYAYF
jgi:predicted mannosyl-3-phosphoglycerate phosphatase (HAD superfamily)